MEYLVVMTLSGSTMTVIYLLLRCLSKNMVSARIYYLLVKAAVLYYLIPLPFVKRWYREVLLVILPEKEMKIARIPLRWTNYAVHAEGRLHINIYAGIQIAMISIWLSVSVGLMVRKLLAYLRTVCWIAGYTSKKMTDRQKAYLAELKKEYGIRRQVLLYEGESGEPGMTFGTYRPVIICSKKTGSREAELLIRHELVHIKRLDAFWKICMEWVTYLHWWNPIMWMLCREFGRICEQSCDETVMSGKTSEEINEYLLLLVKEAQKEKKPEKLSVRWQTGFGNDMREIRERVENLMKKKRWNKVAAGVLVATLVFANSMTVFAYRDTVQREIEGEASQEEIDSILQKDETHFVPDNIDEETEQVFDLMGNQEICYDRQFTDEEGNVYPVPETTPQRGCSHDFVSGTLRDHEKFSDGSCEVVKYKAQRCSKCGYIIQGEWIGTTTFAVCPH